MSLSKIVVSGRVVRAPEKRFTPSTNIAVTEFAIAVESAPRSDGSIETSIVKVHTWRELAERCAQEIQKGDVVVVDGRLQINNYSSAEGQKRRDAEVDAIAVENISALNTSNRGSAVGNEPAFVSVGARSQTKVVSTQGQTSKTDDLDSIFASEDEIPF